MTKAPKIPNAGKGSARNEKCPCGSGKKFKLCHGAVTVDSTAPAAELSLAPPTELVRLDLACGLSPKEGFEGVDVAGDKAKHKVDLCKFPWPWADDSVDEIHCSHFIEHIPAREVEERDLVPFVDSKYEERFLGQDMLLAFFDECWRILKHDSWMQLVCPAARSERAFWDPTHRRFIDQMTFLYLARQWREDNKLTHYKVRCNFGVDVGYTAPEIELLRAKEVHAERFRTSWNVICDWVAKLKAVKQ